VIEWISIFQEKSNRRKKDEKNQMDIRIGGDDGSSLCFDDWIQAELGYEPW
jgi:hypothetical protein